MKKILYLLLITFLSITIIGCDNSDETSKFDKEIAKIEVPTQISSSIYLPETNEDGTMSIVWSSSNQDVLANDGAFFMPSSDTEIVLTATFEYQGETKVKEYNIYVETAEKGWVMPYQMLAASVESSYAMNGDLKDRTYNTFTATYESLDTSILTDDGVIIQKDYDQNVIVKITITNTTNNEQRVYYKRVVVEEYSNNTYASLILEWSNKKLQEYLNGEIETLPTEHEKWPSTIRWTSGDEIAVTKDNKLIKPIEYVDDNVVCQVTYGEGKNAVVLEEPLEITDFGGSTEAEFLDQWLLYIMPTDIIGHKNVVYDQYGTGELFLKYQYAVNEGAVLNLIDGKEIEISQQYLIDVENEEGLVSHWSSSTHPELPDEPSKDNLIAFYNHFAQYRDWDTDATYDEMLAAYQSYEIPNEENILWIVVHETGMAADGNNAELLAQIQYDRAYGQRASASASWNYQIDEDIIYQSFADTVYCWHAGGDYGKYLPWRNSNSIGIEMCINQDGNYDGAMTHDTKLVAYLMHKYNLQMENVVRHHDTSGKECPSYMLRTNRYGEFLKMLRDEYNAIKYLSNAEVTWTISNPSLFEKGPNGLYYAKSVATPTDVDITLNVVKGSYEFNHTVTITLKPDSVSA